jgi:hypothetical protein
MNTEILYIGLIAFTAITVFGVTVSVPAGQLAARSCQVTIRNLHLPSERFLPLAGLEAV